MIVLSLFGTTTGLEIQHFIPGGGASPVKIDNVWLEVSPTQVSLRSDDNCYQIQRRQVDGKTVTWIGLYRAAREIGYDRQGGFYGAGIWLFDVTLDSKPLTESLINLADQVRALALSGGKFTKRLSDIRSEISMPPQMASLATSIASVSSGCSVKGIQAFIADPKSPSLALDWAQKSKTAELFNQIFIASPEQYVANKNEFQQTFRFNNLFDAIDSAYSKRLNDLTHQGQELNKKNQSLNDALQAERLNHQDAMIALKQQDARAEQAVRQLRHDLDIALAHRRDQDLKTSQILSELDRLRASTNAARTPLSNISSTVTGPPIPLGSQPSGPGLSDQPSKMTAINKPVFLNPIVRSPIDTVKNTDRNKRNLIFSLVALVLTTTIGIGIGIAVSQSKKPSEANQSNGAGDVSQKITLLTNNTSSTEQSADKATTPAIEQCTNEKNFVSFQLNKSKPKDKALTPDEILAQLKKSCNALNETTCPKDLAKIDDIKMQLEKKSDKNDRVIFLPEACVDAFRKNSPPSLSLTLSPSSGAASETNKTTAPPKAK